MKIEIELSDKTAARIKKQMARFGIPASELPKVIAPFLEEVSQDCEPLPLCHYVFPSKKAALAAAAETCRQLVDQESIGIKYLEKGRKKILTVNNPLYRASASVVAIPTAPDSKLALRNVPLRLNSYQINQLEGAAHVHDCTIGELVYALATLELETCVEADKIRADLTRSLYYFSLRGFTPRIQREWLEAGFRPRDVEKEQANNKDAA